MIQSCVFTDELTPDFAEAVRICAELRVPYVEVRGLWDTNINRIDDDGAQQMKEILDRYGVRVGCLGSGFGKCSLFDEDEYQEHLRIFERMVHFSDLFDVRLIRVFAFWAPDDTEWRNGQRPDLDAHIEQIAEKLRGPAARAEQEGLILTLETEGSTFAGVCDEVRRVIDAVGSPALTCCWDVANSWSAGRIGYPDGYQHVQGLVSHLHIKDVRFDPHDPTQKTERTYIDCGDIPYPEIFRTLLADGFDGLASVETHLFFGEQNRFAKLQPATINALRNLNRVLAEVQGAYNTTQPTYATTRG